MPRAREPFTPAYTVGRGVFHALFRWVCGMRIEGLDHVPAEGGVLVASNHQSYLDPPLLAAVVPHRQVHFMAKRELFSVPLLGRFLRSAGCFGVDRGVGDRKAVDLALALLERGRVVGIYPEGTRSRDGRLRAGRNGVALLALRAGVPVVPAAVFGTRELLARRMLPGGPALAMRFGPALGFPLDPEPTRARLEEVRDQVMEAVAAQFGQGPPADRRARKEQS